MATKKELIASTLADYTATRNERLALDERSKKLKVKEDGLLDVLTKGNAKSGTYGIFSLDVSKKKVPRVTDWSVFHPYILQSGNIDMLTKHLTASAIMARLDNGEYVPGVVTDDKPVYKITVA